MKMFCLGAFLGLAAVLTGCGVTHSMVKNSSSPAPGAQMQAFFGLGDVIQTVNGIQVTVNADKIFRKNSHRLNKDGVETVDAMAAAILKYPGVFVAVTGYTDNTGTDMKNVKFSQRRADEVKKELMKQGILAEKISAVGNGPVEPAAPNDSAADRARNRRIVFQINAS